VVLASSVGVVFMEAHARGHGEVVPGFARRVGFTRFNAAPLIKLKKVPQSRPIAACNSASGSPLMLSGTRAELMARTYAPSHLPFVFRLRSRAPRSLATVMALSNSAIARAGSQAPRTGQP
jgi:hypothetical protein